jgi:hypothetical protein
MSDEEEAEPSGDGWDSDKNENEDERMPDVEDDDDDMSEADEESEDDDESRSLVVRLRVPSKGLQQATQNGASPSILNGAATAGVAGDDSTQAGAPKSEPDRLEQRVASATHHSIENGGTNYLQPTSSPNGPSSYPTPTSSSFLPVEQQKAMMTTANVVRPDADGMGLYKVDGTKIGTVPPQEFAARLNETHYERSNGGQS